MVEPPYSNEIFMRQTQNLQVGDRFLVRSDDDIPEWMSSMDIYKGKWFTVTARNGYGKDTHYTAENGFSAFFTQDIAQVILKSPNRTLPAPNLPSV